MFMYCLLYQLSYVSMTGIVFQMPVLFYVCEINLNEFIFYVNS